MTEPNEAALKNLEQTIATNLPRTGWRAMVNCDGEILCYQTWPEIFRLRLEQVELVEPAVKPLF